MSASAATACLLSVARPLAARGDRAVCLPAAAESMLLRVATQLPELGSAAPRLRAARAPRRHALALQACFSDSPEPSAARQPAIPGRLRRLLDSPSLVSGLHRCVQCGKWADRELGELRACVKTLAKFQPSPEPHTRRSHGSGATAVQKTPADAAVERTWNCMQRLMSKWRAGAPPPRPGGTPGLWHY